MKVTPKMIENLTGLSAVALKARPLVLKELKEEVTDSMDYLKVRGYPVNKHTLKMAHSIIMAGKRGRGI